MEIVTPNSLCTFGEDGGVGKIGTNKHHRSQESPRIPASWEGTRFKSPSRLLMMNPDNCVILCSLNRLVLFHDSSAGADISTNRHTISRVPAALLFGMPLPIWTTSIELAMCC